MSTALALRRPLLVAFALSLGAAISLGIARFSYALLLPPMRSDLAWSYLTAGAMNTANALGYFLGALAAPAILRRFGPRRTLIGGALLTALFTLLCGLVVDATLLLAQRLLAGVASAWIFIAGGLLAARLAALHAGRGGLLLGLYYGGTGFGIIASALLVPATIAAGEAQAAAHSWQWSWLALGALCLALTAVMRPALQGLAESAPVGPGGARFRVADFRYGLAGYFMFGVGYIGYMTFVIALLRNQGMTEASQTIFYALLGLAVVASSRIWAPMLDRFRGGQSLAILNGLLALATLLPVLSQSLPAVFASGLLFGAVFLSAVASTTALVRHNLPQHAWSAGISGFTTVFALGQIAGPTLAGWISDGAGLERGLVFSSAALLLGALLASRQRALTST
ncbi:MAG TPA: YbfB/YjiJ family MFS transporter [Noviherbaspirillum sp.]